MAFKLKKEDVDFVEFSEGSNPSRFVAALKSVEQAHRKETAELRNMIENQQMQIDALRNLVSELHAVAKKAPNGLPAFAPLREQIKNEFPATSPNNENEENCLSSSGVNKSASFDAISKSYTRPSISLKRSTTPPERHMPQLKKQSSPSPILFEKLITKQAEGKGSPNTFKHAIPHRNISDSTADSDGDSEETCDDPSGIHIFVNEADNSNTSTLEDISESNSNSSNFSAGRSNKDESAKTNTFASIDSLTLRTSNNEMEDAFERIQSVDTNIVPNPSSLLTTQTRYNSKSRKKEDREAMKASSCAQCDKFYIAISGPNLPMDKLKKYCSRHRHEHAAPKTPPGFWDVAFDETS